MKLLFPIVTVLNMLLTSLDISTDHVLTPMCYHAEPSGSEDRDDTDEDGEESEKDSAPAEDAASSPDAEQRQSRRAANIAAMLGNRFHTAYLLIE